MPDNVGYTPGTGSIVAADEINGALYQRIKPTYGNDGTAIDVSTANPLPIVADRTDQILALMGRLVKMLESNQVVDSAQRQRVAIDTIVGGTVTTVSTVASITAGTITNITQMAGMDREQYINIAKQTYDQTIRSKLNFN